MLAAEHQVHHMKFFLDIAMKFHGSCVNRKQYLSINLASYLASATFLPVTELKSFTFYLFQRVKELEKEDEILREKIQALEVSAVSSARY